MGDNVIFSIRLAAKVFAWEPNKAYVQVSYVAPQSFSAPRSCFFPDVQKKFDQLDALFKREACVSD
jgi:hypothetical protein